MSVSFVEVILAGLVLTSVLLLYQNAYWRTQVLQAAQQLFSSIGNAASILVSQIQRVIQAIKEAIDQAVKTLEEAAEDLWKMPKNFIINSVGPTIFQFDAMCMFTHPDWWILTYNGLGSPQTSANRLWMKAEYAVFWATPHPGYTVDEFPYASTQEGGFGNGDPAYVQYAPTSPINENSLQGLSLIVTCSNEMEGGAFSECTCSDLKLWIWSNMMGSFLHCDIQRYWL